MHKLPCLRTRGDGIRITGLRSLLLAIGLRWPLGDTTIMRVFSIAFVLTLAAAIIAYLENSALGVPQLFFLLGVFYAFVLVARWLWARYGNTGRRRNG